MTFEATTQTPSPQDEPVTRSSRASGTALRKLVWDPLALHVRAATRIFIVPDGSLSLIPFAALPSGRTSYLLEQAAPIHYLSSERDLVPAAHPMPTTQGLLALGGPAFDSSARPRPVNRTSAGVTSAPVTTRAAGPGCGNFQTIRFEPLNGTLQEVNEVAALWRRASSPSALTDTRVLVGAAATERTFKQEAAGHRVLHLATHGFFLGENCAPVPSGTRAVGGLASASGKPAPKIENPLLLSGLALAGANRRQTARADEDDGILTAEEVATLNLADVEWAVLSACDTGVGQVKAGEGVFGLRRAFQVAGARTVIMSLWSVDDQATRAWMRSLYDARFQKGMTTADAMQTASLSILRDRRAKGQSTNPFFWAGFVAVGDWQ
jgi:CHAT domain-containing protein